MATGVSRHSDGVGAEALANATGRTPEQWVALLDEQDATTWTHTQIARWVFENNEIDGWWAQSVTVMYEQERGMRQPGQMADGTFSVSSSKTVDGDQQAALDLAIRAFTPAHDEPVAVSRDANYPSARWKVADGSTLLARMGPTKNGRTSLTMTQSRIGDAASVPQAKQAIADALEKLVVALS